MALSDEQKQAVQDTWAQVVPIADTAAELFYGRLFELDPALQRLFHTTDMKEQRKKLMQTLGVAVSGLDRPVQLTPVLEDLGRRHVQYEVKEKDYDTVGAALLWTLERGLGEAFTPFVRDAWAETYGLVAGIMRRAAYDGHSTQATA
jgi:hemoglobin-like flavoprotein